MALGENEAGTAGRMGVAAGEEIAKGPVPAGRQIAQRPLVAAFGRDFPPSCVKHCQFIPATVTSFPSRLITLNQPSATRERRFDFNSDCFAFANELLWEYQFDRATGKMNFRKREPQPAYAHRCFVLVRAARQFLYHARFEPEAAPVGDEVYRSRVRQIVARNPREACPPAAQIVIPGFASLREFSGARETLLKDACGRAWRSYVLRSHWRMVLPISRGHQARTAASLAGALAQGQSPIIHLVQFPSLTINHGMILFAGAASAEGYEFSGYDPNNPRAAVALRYDQGKRMFFLPANAYWAGGELKVIEIFRTWWM
jgi:hypothetical protein